MGKLAARGNECCQSFSGTKLRPLHQVSTFQLPIVSVEQLNQTSSQPRD